MDVKSNEYLWVEKYRPTTLETYIGNTHMKDAIATFLKSGDVPHLLLSGPPGTGKTTAAKIIAKTIECDYIYLNASDENSIDTVRTKIKNFAAGASFKDLKIIILDESDYFSTAGQSALRNVMETYSKTTRFILTCNYVERMMDAIVSRTQHFHVVPPSKVDVAKHVANILKNEQVTFDLADLKIILDAHFPDIRKVIQECQLYSHSGQLKINRAEIIESDSKLKIIEILSSKVGPKQKFQDIRQALADADMRDFMPLYRELYEKVLDYAPNNVSQTILCIAEGQYRDALVVDKEINAAATLINILQGL